MLRDLFAAIPLWFGLIFVGFILLFVGVTAFIIVVAVRNARKVQASGHDPLTLESELMTKAADSQVLAPRQTLEQRLAELDDLHTRGLITEAEHAEGRRAAIAGN